MQRSSINVVSTHCSRHSTYRYKLIKDAAMLHACSSWAKISCTVSSWSRNLLPNTGYTREQKQKTHSCLSSSNSEASFWPWPEWHLRRWHWHNYHHAFRSLAQHSRGIVCGEKWLDKTVPGKQCLVGIEERNRNFINIIPSTCFFSSYRCFLLTQSQSQSIHFGPGIVPTSQQWRENVFEMYLVQWNVGQSPCHDSCLGNR